MLRTNWLLQGGSPTRAARGNFFGLDEARRFKEANGVRMIVRSHELMHAGWSIAGKKDVITIFSSLDYRNTGNDGGQLLRKIGTSTENKDSSTQECFVLYAHGHAVLRRVDPARRWTQIRCFPTAFVMSPCW